MKILFAPLLAAFCAPLWAGEYNLAIDTKQVTITGNERTALAVNDSIPGPLLRWREGEEVTINVTNRLDEPSSIHWHGLILPPDMDGVPGISFDGIPAGETFTYRFRVRQNGTYWYHSHSGLQEQSGVYGPIVIEPAQTDPNPSDREHVIVLSDWTDEDPHRVFAKLKKHPDYYNFRRRTVGDFFRDVAEQGWAAAWRARMDWAQMRMLPTDISDVTGHTYTYLVNGQSPEKNWTALFRPGERIRLRFINGSAMTYFDVRIPGLKMTVVQADGQNVQPVTVDEFRIAVAETYDVIVEPREARAYTLFAESMDRSGFARGTLVPRRGMSAPVPALRKPPLLTMKDMGMDHSSMGGGHAVASNTGAVGDNTRRQPTGMIDHAGHGMADHMAGMNAAMPNDTVQTGSAGGHNGHAMAATPPMPRGDPMAEHDRHALPAAYKGPMEGSSGGEHAGMSHGMDSPEDAESRSEPWVHGPDHHGPANEMVAQMPVNRLHEPGTGLEDAPHRVLVYTDLRSRVPNADRRKPERELELHLTGSMERYIWSFNGKKFSEAVPIQLRHNERVRVTLVNDTMMNHPIHLHGMWSELDNGNGTYNPRKHTINVKPGERMSFDLTADALGEWAFHCHLLYHMDAGMFRKVIVSETAKEVTQ